MNPEKHIDPLIEAAFAQAEDAIEPGEFIAEVVRRSRARRRSRRIAMLMAIATGGCVALLSVGDALSIFSKRVAFAAATPTDFLVWLFPLIIAGVITDSLLILIRDSRRDDFQQKRSAHHSTLSNL
jgi:hypothetical protein